MSRKAGKSIIASFGVLSSSLSDEVTSGTQEPRTLVRNPGRVGAGVIGATQRTLSELREERDRLERIVQEGAGQELDPEQIDPSPFPDRLPDDGEPGFEMLKKAIASEGQKVPIQVRPHPAEPGRFQVVYGHRRWRAARELGLKVKATVLDLTDEELVVVQGIENSVRQDLSWIERSLFSWRMDRAGIRTRDIKAALTIDDPELARLRAVPKVLPIDLIESIGRASRIGRPRWSALAAAVSADPGSVKRIRAALSADKGSPSDQRFKLAYEAAVGRVIAPAAAAGQELVLASPSGRAVGKAAFKAGEVRISIRKSEAEAFSSFLRAELPELVERFYSRNGE